MLVWRKDAAGNRIAAIDGNHEKFLFNIDSQFTYVCNRQFYRFSILTTEELFKGKALTLKEAMSLSEQEYENYQNKHKALTTVISNICKDPFIFYQDYRIYIKADLEDTIRYTTNGKAVRKNSKEYTEPFVYEEGMIIKAIAFNDNKTKSTQVTWKKEI